ncbi:hypothetical protein AU190_13135 [Mycolicibacterium acapulense]|uniref:Uncharacterized protein n=1 Tax=Mycobacterium lehmannii TaxID=2048550 RepID=A0A101A9F0_9MYCO|nr:hypothetical protein [Mycobacterium lehmannii]KUH94176.1 hypothetical protein AU189_04165 [Mycolicibacterium acapulense]KUH97627.1 hypothetical protein AU190_13135 [Mycolicibacterium acapulense]KUI07432.1 hypothetical protein AU191_18045 [Mycolicibacterium acapulense]KUI17948.1 hypothetical protein AU192_03660 [Mycobacterium lehmannii]
MTTAGNFRTAAARVTCDVSVAGVPWPAYKLIALVLGALVALVVGIATATTATAVLTGAAVGTVTWLAFSALCSPRT